MRITLSTLNQSYNALVKLAQFEFPKERHKLAYKLSRVIKSAKTEIEALAESLNDLQRRCGIVPGAEVPPEVAEDYNAQAKAFMREEYCDLWGDPIKLDEIAGIVPISPFDLALLDWLIIEEEEEQPKTQTANA